jgi:hypothetical protein
MQVTIYKSFKHVKEPTHVNVSAVLKTFKTADNYGIKAMADLRGDDYKKAKEALPVVCFGGTFSERSNGSLQKASGLMILDFDNLADLNGYVARLRADEYCYSIFKSPSGRGLKMLVKIPIVKDDAEYKLYYLSFMQRYKDLDTSGKDISRCCFYCSDSDLWINESSKVWDKKHEGQQEKKLNPQIFAHNDYSKANKVLNVIRNAQVGERHTKILNASRLMGGYVGNQSIDYEEAKRLLEQEAYNIDPDDFKLNQRAIIDGLEHGMKSPLSDTITLEKEIEKEAKFGKIYYTLVDKDDEIEELWKNGIQRGYDIGFEEAKDLYTVKLGCTSYVYGAPYSGKSQFWFEVLMNLSVFYDMKHAIFSPETGRAEDIFIELIEIYAKSDFYDTYKNKMTEDQKVTAKQFVDQHFVVIDPQMNVLTVDDFFDYCDIVERVFNVKIHTTTIDPWNELKHDFGGDRQDIYLERILGFVRENARKNQRHNCIITHVQDQQIQTSKEGVRYYPPATYREIAGGQTFSRKGLGMICVWRAQEGLKDEHGQPFEHNESVIFIQKAKPKGIGKNGKFSLLYDSKRHRYLDKNGNYASIDRKTEPIQKSYTLPVVESNFEKKNINKPEYMVDWNTGDVDLWNDKGEKAPY